MTSRTNHSTTNSTNAVLRPRNRRLISGLDEEELNSDANSGISTRIASPRGSPFGSRPSSPIPSKHPSRVTAASLGPSRLGERAVSANNASRDPFTSSFSGLWGSSWTALQGLASNVLGSDLKGGSKETSPTRRRTKRPVDDGHKRVTGSAPPSQWGPSSSPGRAAVGVGSQEQREALVRERKRKDLLDAGQDAMMDSIGRFKRRNSDDYTSSSMPPPDHEDKDALVYVHHVKPADTLAGITIKYNCHTAVIRKANRMWPNDSVQIRKAIILPVDACGVKGRPVPGPQAEPEQDLLLDDTDLTSTSDLTPTATVPPKLSSPSRPNGHTRRRESSLSSTSTALHRPVSSTTSNDSSDPPWKHDSWVLLPGDKDTQPTEIARLPRRALGFFPPARRKSICYSDNPTPSASLELSRPPSLAGNSPRPSLNLSRTRPARSTSSASVASVNRSHRTESFLHGPGGVGTMARNVRAPGPAQDGLNKHFAQYLPSVAPPPNLTAFTPWVPGLLDDTNSPATTPGVAVSPGFEFEQIPGAIEGWVRKVANKAATALHEGSAASAHGKGAAAMGASGLGDLIELTDAFAIGDGEGERDSDETLIPEARTGGLGGGLLGGEGMRERGRENRGRSDLKGN